MTLLEKIEESETMEQSENIKVSISLPDYLLEDFDGVWKGAGYGNRSEAIRHAMRELIQKIKRRRKS